MSTDEKKPESKQEGTKKGKVYKTDAEKLFAISEEYYKNPFVTDVAMAETLNLDRKTVAKYRKELEDELRQKLITSKEDDLLSYYKVLSFITKNLVEIINVSARDMHRIFAMNLLAKVYEKLIALKLDLGIHRKPVQEIDVTLSIEEEKTLETVLGGLINNLDDVEYLKKQMATARRLEAGKSKPRVIAGPTTTEQAIKARIAAKGANKNN